MRKNYHDKSYFLSHPNAHSIKVRHNMYGIRNVFLSTFTDYYPVHNSLHFSVFSFDNGIENNILSRSYFLFIDRKYTCIVFLCCESCTAISTAPHTENLQDSKLSIDNFNPFVILIFE